MSTVNPSFLSNFQAPNSSFSSTRKNQTRETDRIEEEESVPSIKSKAFKHCILLPFLGRRIRQDIDHIILLAALFVSSLLFLHLMLSLLHSQGPDLGGESSSPLSSSQYILCLVTEATSKWLNCLGLSSYQVRVFKFSSLFFILEPTPII